MKYSRLLLGTIYLLSNIIFFFIMSSDLLLRGDFKQQVQIDQISLNIGLSLILLSFLFIFSIFSLSENSNRHKKTFQDNKKCTILDYIFASLAVLYLIGFYLGYISVFKTVSPPFWWNLSAFIIPYGYIFIIYIYYRLEHFNYISAFVSIVVILTSLVQLQTGVFIFFIPLVVEMMRKKYSYRKITTIILTGILIYPFFRHLKGVIGHFILYDGSSLSYFMDIYFTDFYDDGFLSYYFFLLSRTLERFQHLANISYVISNLDYLNSLVSNNDVFNLYFKPFSVIFDKIISLPDNALYMNALVAKTIDSTKDWNVHLGFFGGLLLSYEYLIILPVTLFIIFFVNIVSNRYLVSSVVDLHWLVVLCFVFHGWFNAYFEFFQAWLVFSIILAVSNTLKRCSFYVSSVS
ncbi:hypothetical protein D0812_16190 [Vibrio owensii]|uniref:Oligosaccharide repeat unit polymerase n=1 Tax=Vibrio owensii TaxID=696485 RepID=A0AAP9GE60_9VIBR|nr:oligosaccharide repeat unit polymerase [Vibrio owensii]AYO15862.1 hypothetical protein D0812_16190 [Vibrio owensii]QGH48486.1 oligosaccharide repeat unit polymerase [Vibrio owensii]